MSVILQRKLLKNVELKDARPLLQFENMSLEEAKNNLQDIQKLVDEQGFQNVRFNLQHTTYNMRLVVYGDRMETDEELDHRQTRANGVNSKKQKRLDEQRAKDLAELARLKALYEV
jgi:hypothetical protein